MQNIAFVTCAEYANLSDDDRIAATVLEKRGIKVNPTLWDSDAVNWKSFDAVVLRSTWDYYGRFAEFSSWLSTLENTQVPLWNPVKTVRWNSEKTYLRELGKQGVTTAPTIIIERGATRSLEGLVKDNGWAKAVVKPVVGAAGYETWLTDPQVARDDQSAFEALLKKSSVIIQAFIPEVAQKGEWSFVFFNKQYSHAVVKLPRPGDFRVQPRYGGTFASQQPPQTLINQAAGIVKLIEAPLLYARVDAVEVNGRLLLMELELIEPMLFFQCDPQAAERFADALEAVVR